MQLLYKLFAAMALIFAFSWQQASAATIATMSIVGSTTASTPYNVTISGDFSGSGPTSATINPGAVVLNIVSASDSEIVVELPGSVTQVADIYTLEVDDGTTDSEIFSVVAGESVEVGISGLPASAVAGTLNFVMFFSFNDAFGNATNGNATTIEFVGSGTSATVPLAFLVEGIFTATTPGLTTATSYTLYVQGFAGTTNGSNQITIIPAEAAGVSVSGLNTPVSAGVAVGTANLLFADQYGNATNPTVTTLDLVGTGTSASVTLTYGGSVGSSTATFAELTTATTYQVQVAGFAGTTTGISSVVVVPAAASSVAISGIPAGAAAGALSGTANLAFRDQYGNATNPTVTTLDFVGTGTSATVALNYGGSVGSSTASLPGLTTATTYTVQVAGFAGTTTGTDEVEVVAGTPGTLAVAGLPASATAGTLSASLTLTFTDSFGNATNASVSNVALVGTGTSATFALSSGGLGVSTATASGLTAAGAYQLQVPGFAGTTTGTASVTITPAAAADVEVTPTTASQLINGDVVVTLNYTDTFGNNTDYTATSLTYSSGSSTASFTLSRTGLGVSTATVSFASTGTYTASVESFAGTYSGTTTLSIAVGFATKGTLVGLPLTTTAGIAGSTTLTLYTTDSFDNPAPASTSPIITVSFVGVSTEPAIADVDLTATFVSTGIYQVAMPTLLLSRAMPALPVTSGSYTFEPSIPADPGFVFTPTSSTVSVTLPPPSISSLAPSTTPPSVTAVSITVTGTDLQQLYAPSTSSSTANSTLLRNSDSHYVDFTLSGTTATSVMLSFQPTTSSIYTLALTTPAGTTTAILSVGAPGEVTSTADSGPGSLRDAITFASSGTVITISPSLIGQVISLLSPIEIDKVIFLEIPAPGLLFLNGNGGPAVMFDCGSAGTLIKGVEIVNTGSSPRVISICPDVQGGTAQSEKGPI